MAYSSRPADGGADASTEADAKPAPPARKSDVTEGRTLFVRGVPFDMEESALWEEFAVFGDLVYAKVVKDKATGVSRGTGFVMVRSC